MAVDSAFSQTSGAVADATYVTTENETGTFANSISLGALSTGLILNSVAAGVATLTTATEGTDYWAPGGTDVALADGGTGASTPSGARAALDAQQTLSGLAVAAATVAGTDKILGQDADDADNLKTFTAQSIADLAGGGSGGASTALDNLAAVSINTSLISDSDVTDDLGSVALRWQNIYAQSLGTGDTLNDTLFIRGWNTNTLGFASFITIVAGNPPTCNISGTVVLNDGVTATTQPPSTNDTTVATTNYVDSAVSASGGANTALSNLAAVAINTSLISDTDVTDNLGSQAIRWNNIYAATLQTGDTAADTLQIGAWDVDGAALTTFITLTANNVPTCSLSGDVTGVTQSASDGSTKLATTQYVDTAVGAGGGETAKVWLNASGDGLTINDSFNVTSITDTGAGRLTITIDTDFANATYVVTGVTATSGLSGLAGGAISAYVRSGTIAVGSVQVNASGEVDGDQDPNEAYHVAMFGDQ